MAQDDHDIHFRGRFRGQRGAALVEFAICSTLFLVLIYAAISFGVIFWVKHTLTSSASEGARAAVGAPLNTGCTTPSHCDEIAAARAKARGVVNAGLGDRGVHVLESDIITTVATCVGSSRDCITVKVRYPYGAHPILPVLFPFLPNTLSSTSVIELS